MVSPYQTQEYVEGCIGLRVTGFRFDSLVEYRDWKNFCTQFRRHMRALSDCVQSINLKITKEEQLRALLSDTPIQVDITVKYCFYAPSTAVLPLELTTDIRDCGHGVYRAKMPFRRFMPHSVADYILATVEGDLVG